ncbi:hypothetical protein H6G76_17340 [Nostoc sp. FACHB-152]|uniref:hypothetical protein n=1 Tax=unclassified Nostoc TaxID=2593658 RepID=UPI001684CA30|nr:MULTISPECIES: hypothetical protein [unclassified Nostoc]MBD2448888.1 hypothetical protein [Nostoc sp. FACHB-152]MBD2469783.1 hypothetical protein [Nostoc sp. FACHB-145]
MQLKLTRRQFGQLAIFSTTIAAVGAVINQTLAQESNKDPVILGIKTGLRDNNAPTNLDSDIIDPFEESQITEPSALQPLIVESLNVRTQEIQTLLTTAPILETCERLSGFASINGKLIAAASYTCTRKKKDKKVRLIDLYSLESVNLSGLKNNEDLYQLMRLANGSLGGLVGKDKGKGFSRIVTIDLNTGQITDRKKVPEQKRVTAVAESSGGSLYGINTDKLGEIALSQIGDKQSKQLKYRGMSMNDGCDGLVWTPSNELYALLAFRYESPKYLHRINRSTGEMERIQGFDVAKIALE